MLLTCGSALPLGVWPPTTSAFVPKPPSSSCSSTSADALIRDQASPVKEFMLDRGGWLRLESGEDTGVSSDIKSSTDPSSGLLVLVLLVVVVPASSGGRVRVREASSVNGSLVSSDVGVFLDSGSMVVVVVSAVQHVLSVFFVVSW